MMETTILIRVRRATLIGCLIVVCSTSTAAEVYYPPVAESLERLGSTNQHVRDRGMRALVGMGKAAAPAYDELIATALSSNNLPRTRSSAAEALRNIDSARATTHFVQELTNSSAMTREYAVDALMTIRHPAAVIPLFRRLRDQNERVRSRAGIALQFYEDQELETLLLAALSDPTDKAREWAPWLLGRMNSRAALPSLHAALDDTSSNFRKSVVAALRDIGSKASVPPLIKVVTHDSNDDIRMRAIQCLGELGDPRAAATVTAALDDENPEVRAYAAGAVAAIGVEHAKPRLRELSERGVGRERIAAIGALCQMGDTNVIPAIRLQLDSEHEIIVGYMIEALVELGAEAELVRLQEHANPRVRSAAEHALKKLNEKTSIQQDKSSVRGKPRR